MLKNLALDYYYLNISTSTIIINFNQVYYSIKNYFEEVQYKQIFFLKQNKLIFKSIINKSEGKPIKKCLKKLINELWHLQYELDPEF